MNQLNEFELIRQYFVGQPNQKSDSVKVDIGDDCAVVEIPPGSFLAISTDTLIEGVHFPKPTCPYDIGFKSLAVNLSDLAAQGAKPTWFTLALTIPEANQNFLEKFSQGLFDLANQYQMQLIGGDTTKGPLSITIQAMGLLNNNLGLRRSCAETGDAIFVSGYLGSAAFGLQQILQNYQPTKQNLFLNKLNKPEPRVLLGQQLIGIANACIDISDGLLADLKHILKSSDKGALVYVNQIPIDQNMIKEIGLNDALKFALTGGDEYELCFTVPKQNLEKLKILSKHLNLFITQIGEIIKTPEIRLEDAKGQAYTVDHFGYQHF